MEPVASGSQPSEDNVARSGLLADNSFKPLKGACKRLYSYDALQRQSVDVHPIRRKQIPRLAHGLEAVVKK